MTCLKAPSIGSETKRFADQVERVIALILTSGFRSLDLIDCLTELRRETETPISDLIAIEGLATFPAQDNHIIIPDTASRY